MMKRIKIVFSNGTDHTFEQAERIDSSNGDICIKTGPNSTFTYEPSSIKSITEETIVESLNEVID